MLYVHLRISLVCLLFYFLRVLVPCEALCSMSGCFIRVEFYKSRTAKADDDKIQPNAKSAQKINNMREKRIFSQEEMLGPSIQHARTHCKLQCA